MDIKAESSGVGYFDRNDDWIIPYLEAGRNCGFHIFPVLRVNLIHFQSLEYSIVELNPKCTYGFIQNTLVNNHSIHKGLQWVMFVPTLVDVYGYNGHPRVGQCLTHAFDINFHDSIDFCASPLIKRDLT